MQVLLAESGQLSGLETGLLYVSLAIYIGASVVGWRVVKGDRRDTALPRILGVGMLVLTALLASMAVRQGGLPIVRRFEVLTVAAWMLALGAWLVARWADAKIVGAVSAPTLALLVFSHCCWSPRPRPGPWMRAPAR